MNLELIVKPEQLEQCNKAFVKDILTCYQLRIGVYKDIPITLPEYMKRVYVPSLYADFIVSYMAHNREPRREKR